VFAFGLTPLLDLVRESPSNVSLTAEWVTEASSPHGDRGEVGQDLIESDGPLLSRFDDVQLVVQHVSYDPTSQMTTHFRQYDLTVDVSVEAVHADGAAYIVDRDQDQDQDLLRIRSPFSEGQHLTLADQLVVAEGGVETVEFSLPGDPSLVANGLIALPMAAIVTLSLYALFRRAGPPQQGYRYLRPEDSLCASRLVS